MKTTSTQSTTTPTFISRMGSEVSIIGPGSKLGYVKCLRVCDGAIRQYHELDLRAPEGLAQIRAAVMAAQGSL